MIIDSKFLPVVRVSMEDITPYQNIVVYRSLHLEVDYMRGS